MFLQTRKNQYSYSMSHSIWKQNEQSQKITALNNFTKNQDYEVRSCDWVSINIFLCKTKKMNMTNKLSRKNSKNFSNNKVQRYVIDDKDYFCIYIIFIPHKWWSAFISFNLYEFIFLIQSHIFSILLNLNGSDSLKTMTFDQTSSQISPFHFHIR
jgi:hypothetical protein